MRLQLLLAIPLFFPLVSPQSLQAETISGTPTDTVQSFILGKAPATFPDMRANYIKTVAEPAAQAAQEGAEQPQAAPAVVYAAPAVQAVWSGLVGSYGYALSGGNCVNQIPPALRGEGNPINWTVTTYQPYIGAAALWAGVNHVARVTGLWSNGDIEVAQENWSGPPITRFSRSTFRGFR